MITTFSFYERPPDSAPGYPCFTRVSGRGAVLALPLDVDDDAFDRQGYGGSRFAYLTMETRIGGDRPATGRSMSTASLMVETTRVMRAKGDFACPVAGVVLVTLADLATADVDAFLRQFSAASAFMERQSGFRAARLYRERISPGRTIFINVAGWTTVADFVAAFSSDAFKRIIVGGFEARSRIMVAHLPVAEHLEAAQ